MATAPAFADHIREEVKVQTRAAGALGEAGDFKLARVKLDDARKIPNLSSAELKYISNEDYYVRALSGDFSDLTNKSMAEGKFARDFKEQKWAQVIADVPMLERAGAYNAQQRSSVANAYYHLGDARGSMKVAEEALAWSKSRQLTPADQKVIQTIATGLEFVKQKVGAPVAATVAASDQNNVADDFARNPTGAMAKYSNWQKAQFSFMDVNFTNGRFTAGYSTQPDFLLEKMNREEEQYKRQYGHTNIMPVYVPRYNITCIFSGDPSAPSKVKQGETRSVLMKLTNANGTHFVFDCRL